MAHVFTRILSFFLFAGEHLGLRLERECVSIDCLADIDWIFLVPGRPIGAWCLVLGVRSGAGLFGDCGGD